MATKLSVTVDPHLIRSSFRQARKAAGAAISMFPVRVKVTRERNINLDEALAPHIVDPTPDPS